MTLEGASIGFFFGVRWQAKRVTAPGFVRKSNRQVAKRAKDTKLVGNCGEKPNSNPNLF